ncbi:hypothetical protein KIN20_010796 [Parelaphostrongylus tenuis]|uniref:Uncharacterized protein n=1 Tax=Parelaphostrongylus tenuis TaxID=148309 RepID=A0AAD5M8E7_PARTN|nr:hypothetical protein KIN20_010796 [Parelaphostrongylus tenuis]
MLQDQRVHVVDLCLLASYRLTPAQRLAASHDHSNPFAYKCWVEVAMTLLDGLALLPGLAISFASIGIN